MPATTGSIAEYDAVLSVSEEAINRQLEVLYKHKIVESNAPSQIEGYADTAPARYLINHTLRMRPLQIPFEEHQDKYLGPGILGHISCPRVTFQGQEPGYIKISIDFAHDQEITDIADVDSDPDELPTEAKKEPFKPWFFFWEGYGPMAQSKCVDITGWTVSWRAKLNQTNIQDVMEDIIKPSQDTKSSVAAPAALINKLNVVKSEDFLVSSIFCAIELHTFMNSFTLTDADKKDLAKQDSADYTTVLAVMSKYFTNMKTTPGVPNPNNPFVLGYGIAQKLPAMKDKHPELSTDKTPKYMIPKDFHISTTQGSDFTKGTLNYLIMTHREAGQSARNNDQKTGVGDIGVDFFKTTRTTAAKSDAIMAFSPEVFFWDWVGGTLLKQVHFDISSANDSFWSMCRKSGAADKDIGRYSRADSAWKADTPVGGSPTVKMSQHFRTELTEVDSVLGTHVGWWQEAFSETTVTLNSVLKEQGFSGAALQDDLNRYIDLSIRWKYTVRNMIETRDPWKWGSWSEAYERNIALGYIQNIRIEIRDDSPGTWTATTMPGSTLPQSYNEMINVRLQDTGAIEPDINWDDGFFYWQGAHGVFSPIDIGNIIVTVLQKMGLLPRLQYVPAANAAWLTTQTYGTLKGIANDLQYTIMMPGGEAFFYRGLDTDADCSLYSHLVYRVGADGTTNN